MKESFASFLRRNQFIALALAGFSTFAVNQLCTNLHNSLLHPFLYDRVLKQKEQLEEQQKQHAARRPNNSTSTGTSSSCGTAGVGPTAGPSLGHLPQQFMQCKCDYFGECECQWKNLQQAPLSTNTSTIGNSAEAGAARKNKLSIADYNRILMKLQKRKRSILVRLCVLHILEFILIILFVYLLANWALTESSVDLSDLLLPNGAKKDPTATTTTASITSTSNSANLPANRAITHTVTVPRLRREWTSQSQFPPTFNSNSLRWPYS